MRCAVPGGKAAGILPVATVRPPALRDPGGKLPEDVAPAWGADGAARRPCLYRPSFAGLFQRINGADTQHLVVGEVNRGDG